MIPGPLPPLANHLWQSTVFAGVVWLLTLALRGNRAAVRHGLWVAASVKFLAPLALLVAVGNSIEWPKPPVLARPGMLAKMTAVERVSDPFIEVTPPRTNAETPRKSPLLAILFGLWVCGFLGNCMAWWRRWRRLRSANLLGIFGIFRPRLRLPEGIPERLTPRQLEAVIAHEQCHVRRRDNLTAAIHMLVEALFWFHPLVWWMETRLVEERERACDEEVLRLGSDPQDYAEGIVNVAKFYLESPLACVAGVTGADLKSRVEAIMLNRGAARLSFGKRLLLAAAGMSAVVVGLLLGVAEAPRLRAQSAPKFEVVSVKPCLVRVLGLDGLEVHPGRLSAHCLAAQTLIGTAYVALGNPTKAAVFGSRTPVSGGPEWLKTENYDIEAKAEGAPNPRVMEGPMLQGVLEDRFKLKLHRETRMVPVYELTAAKGGAKLHRVQAGSCAPLDRTQPLDMANPEHKPWCAMTFHGKQGAQVIQVHGMNLDRIARSLTDLVDRPVVDKTGLEGLYDLEFEYVPEVMSAGGGGSFSPTGRGVEFHPAGPSDEPAAGPSIFTALREQLGLKLEAAKGPGEFIVIDSVERPSAN